MAADGENGELISRGDLGRVIEQSVLLLRPGYPSSRNVDTLFKADFEVKGLIGQVSRMLKDMYGVEVNPRAATSQMVKDLLAGSWIQATDLLHRWVGEVGAQGPRPDYPLLPSYVCDSEALVGFLATARRKLIAENGGASSDLTRFLETMEGRVASYKVPLDPNPWTQSAALILAGLPRA